MSQSHAVAVVAISPADTQLLYMLLLAREEGTACAGYFF